MAMSAAVQLMLVEGGHALPVDPVLLANENCFEVRHILRGLDLDDEQIACAEAAVAAVRAGTYLQLATTVASSSRQRAAS
jgi:hypothetical protein